MSFLDDILDSTRARVRALDGSTSALEQRLASIGPPRGFAGALRGPDVSAIAEIKRATPLKGDLNRGLDPGAMARAYAAGGAAAISVLTEPSGFQGSLEDLVAVQAAGLPTLRKDFVLDPVQLLESRAYGADAVLLIVRILGADELRALMKGARTLGLDALVEIHDEPELERALEVGADLIGVNHRDLTTFDVDPDRTAKLAPLVPDEVTLVALSGVSTRAQVEALREAGAHAVLIGEALVTSEDPEATLRELIAR